jgi:hypothetical protein
MKLLFISLIGLFLLGCNPSDNKSDSNYLDVNTGINSNFSNWNDSETRYYTYILEYEGQFEISGKWEVQVSDGEVIYFNYVGDGNPAENLSIEFAPTINALFEDILACDNSNACSVIAKFDENNFFPNNVYIDKGKYGYGFTVTEFVVH